MITRLSFRLKPGKDDDLIKWLNGLPEQERSRFIREALRRGLSLPDVRPAVSPVINARDGTQGGNKGFTPAGVENITTANNLEEKLDRLADCF